MAGDFAGELFIKLVPSAGPEFRKQAQKELDTNLKGVEAKVGVGLTAGWKKEFEAELKTGLSTVDECVDVCVNIPKDEIKKAVNKANAHFKTLKNKPSLSIGLSVTALEARKAITQANARLKASKTAAPKLKVQLDLDEKELALVKEARMAIKNVGVELKGAPIEIKMDLDEESIAAVRKKAALVSATMQAQLDQALKDVDKRAQLVAAQAVADADAARLKQEASTQGRLAAAKEAGLDQDTLREKRKADAIELIAQRHAVKMAEIAARGELAGISKARAGQLVKISRSLRDDLSGLEFSTTRLLRRLTFSFGLFTAGVTASFAAITGAAIVQFAKIEEAANKSASLFTAQEMSGSKATGAAFERKLLATSEDFTNRIIAKSREVAVATKFNNQEIAEGFRFLAGAGVEIEQSLGSIGTVARLAQAGFMELESTSELLAQSWVASGKDIKQFGAGIDEFSDKLVFVANESAITLEEALKAFTNRSAASFVSLGQSADEALNVIRLFGQTGIKGLKAGEQSSILIREIVRSAQPDRGAAAWKKYGLSLKDASGNVKSFATILDDLTKIFNKKTGGFKDPAALAAVLKEFQFTEKSNAGLRQLLPSIARLQKTAGGAAGALEALQESSGGRLSAQTKAVTDTLAFQYEAFTNNVANIASVFATNAGGQIKEFLKDLNGMGDSGEALFERLEAKARSFGESFGGVMNSMLRQLGGAEGRVFFGGIEEGVKSTLKGVSDAFIAFRNEVYGEGSDIGFLAFIGRAFAATGNFVERTLPRIARAIGTVINAVNENREAVEAFVRVWLSIFVGAKLNRWFVLPLLGIANNLEKVYGWIIAMGSTKAVGALSAATTEMQAFSKASKSAAEAQVLLGSAQIWGPAGAGASGAASTAAVAAQAGILGKLTSKQLDDIKKLRQESAALDQVFRGVTGGGVTGGGPAVGAQPPKPGEIAKATNELTKFQKVVSAINGEIKIATGFIGRIGGALSGLGGTLFAVGKFGLRFAGWIGVAIAALDFGIGFVKGFMSEMKKGLDENKDASRLFSGIGDALRWLGNAVQWAFEKLQPLLGVLRTLGEYAGKIFAKAIISAADAVVDLYDAFVALFGWLTSNAGNVDENFQKFKDSIDELAPSLQKASAAATFFTNPSLGVSMWNAAEATQEMNDQAIRTIDIMGSLKPVIDTATTSVRRNATVSRTSLGTIPKYVRDVRKHVWVLNEEWVRGRKVLLNFVNVLRPVVRRAIAQARTLAGEMADAAQSTIDAISTMLPGVGGFINGIVDDASKGLDNLAARFVDLGVLQQQNRRRRRATAETPTPEGGAGGAVDATTDALAEVKTAAELATEAVNKLTQKQLDKTAASLVAKLSRSTASAYKATAFEAEVLRRALTGMEAQLDRQRSAVQKLDEALQSLQGTQLKGTKAFNEAQFASEQEIKKLQLQRIDLVISGVSEQDAAVAAIDAQINSLQRLSERAQLAFDIDTAPLKKQLDELFNPAAGELPFEEIKKRFAELSGKKAPLVQAIAGGEQLAAAVNAVVADADARFGEAGRQVSAGFVGGMTASLPKVNEAGVKTGNAALAGVNEVMAFGSPSRTMYQRGVWANEGFINGVNSSLAGVQDAGVATMWSFLTGMRNVYENRVQPFVTQIATWIKDNKGPVSYDRQLLKPAGQAMMEGFHRGLDDGFGEVKRWVHSVAGTIGDNFPKELMFERSANFLLNNAKADATFTADDAFGDLITDIMGGFGGGIDPSLMFLHKTLSMADTTDMARRLMLFAGMNPNNISVDRYAGARTSAGFISDHTKGTAADLGTGSNRPTQESIALFAKLKPLIGIIFKQLIHNGLGLDYRGGTFADSAHADHIHAAWLTGDGFSKHSGRKGVGMLNIPGVSAEVLNAIATAAQVTGLNPALIAAVMKQESGFRPSVVSGDGGYGLMQLTSPGLKAKAGSGLLDPVTNALVGSQYLRDLINQLGSIKLGLSAYNSGPGGGERYGRVDVPQYVSSVMAFYEEFMRKMRGTGNFRAMGGPVNSMTAYGVNERGHELFIPGRGGTMISAKDFRDLVVAMQSQKAQQAPTVVDSRTINVQSNSPDPVAVAAMVDARMRAQVVGVNR